MRRGGFTNLSFVVVNGDTEGVLVLEDLEDAEAASAATSLVRRRAVLVALEVSKASAVEKKSSTNVPTLTRLRQA